MDCSLDSKSQSNPVYNKVERSRENNPSLQRHNALIKNTKQSKYFNFISELNPAESSLSKRNQKFRKYRAEKGKWLP